MSAACGYLVIVFDEFERFQDYYFVNVPFNKCYARPSIAWDCRGKMTGSLCCKYYLRAPGIVEYYAVTGNLREAYHSLEHRVLDAGAEIERIAKSVSDTNPERLQESVNQVTEDLITEEHTLYKTLPGNACSSTKQFYCASLCDKREEARR